MDLSSAPAGRRRRKRSRLGSGPPKSLRFIYRTYNSNALKFYLLSIPSKEFDFFEQRDVNYYTSNDHRKRDSTIFRDISSIYPSEFLLSYPVTPFSKVCPLGKSFYFISSSQYGEPLQFWSYDPFHTDPPKLLAPPNSQKRYFAHAFSLCGKVYACAGLIDDPELHSRPFGEVYDPRIGTWSPIARPDDSDALISTRQLFIASLGESNAKILVSHYHESAHRLVYIYDIATQGWITPLIPPENFEPEFAYSHPVINKDDNLVYWIDERRGFMYSLDWKKMHIYSGPVVGLEHDRLLSNLKGVYHAFSLSHLWDDYFCIVWSTPSTTDREMKENHFTFIKVVKYPATDSLVAFVLGCFMDLGRDSPDIIDCIRV